MRSSLRKGDRVKKGFVEEGLAAALGGRPGRRPPRPGRWLNVAEVELNVMIRQCLNRRIDCIEVLRREVAACPASRARIQAKVDWQFTTDDARPGNANVSNPTFDE